ncbi:MAG TPA: YCF48-related protein [Planctomycetota bacterium]|nr:YCF48-related protein [Planctomycetota bacterium]
MNRPIGRPRIPRWRAWIPVFLVCGIGAAQDENKDEARWVKVDAGTQEDLTSVCMPTNQEAWIVGSKGLVLHSADRGKTWARQESGLAKADLYSVHFVDDRHGWACGGIGDGAAVGGHILMGRPVTASAILKTQDGGKTWEKVWPSTNFDLKDVWMADRERGAIVCHGGMRHKDGDTLRGGASWKSNRAYRALNAVQLVDATTGFAVGTRVSVGFSPTPTSSLYTERACQILRTTDGGASWLPLAHEDLGKGVDLYDVSFVDAKSGWVCGDAGVILRTEDGGASWTRQASHVSTRLKCIFAIDAERAWSSGAGGVILRTTDSGRTWSKVESGTEADLLGLWFSPEGAGVIVGSRGTLLIRTPSKDSSRREY